MYTEVQRVPNVLTSSVEPPGATPKAAAELQDG